MRLVLILFLVMILMHCSKRPVERTSYFPKQVDHVQAVPDKKHVWVFLLAGQSNMAGRGMVEAEDTIPEKRVLSINKDGQLILAKEPLHFYEPLLAGLDCGYSFGKTLIKNIPDSISILLIPTAVGGSSISQWLGDSVHRNVQLFSNFRSKAEIAKRYGDIKAILWHQGESDANRNDIPFYSQRLAELVRRFRSVAGNDRLPVLFGELGAYSNDKENWLLLNKAIRDYSAGDFNTAAIATGDLKDKGDHIHFDSKSQRKLGQRFAQAYISMMKAFQ